MDAPKSGGQTIYEVINRISGEKHATVATTSYDACKNLGWIIGDCLVNEVKPTRHKIPNQPVGLLVHIPCQVCFYQYATCQLPQGQQCPCRPNAPELAEWIKQATEAHNCPHVGQDIYIKDYEIRQKWLPLSDAIEELAPHP